MKIEKVTLIGLGAMGSFFAPRLYKGLKEGNFRVLAEGERKERLEKKGVTINGVNYRFPVVEPQKENDPADLIIMAVKDTGLAQALKDIANQVGEHTLILNVMNGVRSEVQTAEIYGWEHVLYSFMRVSIVMKDGVTDYDPELGVIHFGEKTNEIYSERVERIRELFESCSVPYVIDKDMIHGIWFKFMCNVGENMTCALLGIPFGTYRTSKEANALRRAAMWEVAAIAQKKGIDLGEKEIEQQEQVIMNLPPQNKPSTLQDLEAGKKTEVELFSGTVIRMGEELEIDTPVNRVFYNGIKVLEAKQDFI